MGSLGHTLSLRSLMLHSLSLETGQEKLGPVLLSDKKSPRGIARSTIFAQLLFFSQKNTFLGMYKNTFYIYYVSGSAAVPLLQL